MKKILMLAMVFGLLVFGLVYGTAKTVWMKDGREAELAEIRRDITECKQNCYASKASNIDQCVEQCMKEKGYELVKK